MHKLCCWKVRDSFRCYVLSNGLSVNLRSRPVLCSRIERMHKLCCWKLRDSCRCCVLSNGLSVNLRSRRVLCSRIERMHKLCCWKIRDSCRCSVLSNGLSVNLRKRRVLCSRIERLYELRRGALPNRNSQKRVYELRGWQLRDGDWRHFISSMFKLLCCGDLFRGSGYRMFELQCRELPSEHWSRNMLRLPWRHVRYTDWLNEHRDRVRVSL